MTLYQMHYLALGATFGGMALFLIWLWLKPYLIAARNTIKEEWQRLRDEHN